MSIKLTLFSHKLDVMPLTALVRRERKEEDRHPPAQTSDLESSYAVPHCCYTHTQRRQSEKTCHRLHTFFQGVDQLPPFIESSLRTVSSGKVELVLFFLIPRILFCKGNKGENTLQKRMTKPDLL